jgi:hypothetical protein
MHTNLLIYLLKYLINMENTILLKAQLLDLYDIYKVTDL